MKRAKSIILYVLFSTLVVVTGKAQDTKKVETEFIVKGICNMCETRIENAAYIKGVKFADWDKETGKLKVVYNSQKTDLESIHQSIADAGHTTEKKKAKKEDYQKLPKCCAYDDGVSKH